MITKSKYSKILEIEKDLLFNQRGITLRRKHFDFGQSITLKYDDSLNVYSSQNSVVTENGTAGPELSNPDSFQFSDNNFFIESFSEYQPETDLQIPIHTNYATQKEDDENAGEEDDRYIVTTSSSGTNKDGTVYKKENTEVYEDEIDYNAQKEREYSEESSFEDDIKKILSGQKQYNQEQKQLVPSVSQSLSTEDDTESSKISDNQNGLKNQEVAHPHAIFESLAQSFGNATSYDLGSFDLDRSFTEIEATIARNEKISENRNPSEYTGKSDPSVLINTDKETGLTVVKADPQNTENAGSATIANSDEATQQLSLNALDISEDFAIINDTAQNNIYKNQQAVQADQIDQNHICETDQYNQSLSIINASSSFAVVPELKDLLSYLQIDYSLFQPVENRYFHRLKELLVFHKTISTNEVLDSSNFMSKVKDFQRTVMNQNNPDGIPGESTLFELQKDWAGTRGLNLVRTGIRSDVFNGSQIPVVLRSDALALYNQLYDQIHNQGGLITSAGSHRELSASVSAGRSSTSMHYLGLALDLHAGSGLQNISDNPYLIERSGANRWHVWNKVRAPQGKMQAVNAQIYNYSTKTLVPVSLNERVIDFKTIANNNGFKDIGNRSCFPADYMCAEWWHFQCEDVLVPYLSQFGTELLTIYNEAQLSAHPNIWQNKRKIFKKDWF